MLPQEPTDAPQERHSVQQISRSIRTAKSQLPGSTYVCWTYYAISMRAVSKKSLQKCGKGIDRKRKRHIETQEGESIK